MTTMFSPTQLQEIVHKTVEAEVPAGHTNAIIGTWDTAGVQVLATFKLGADARWKVTGAVRHDWSGDTEGSAAVMYSW